MVSIIIIIIIIIISDKLTSTHSPELVCDVAQHFSSTTTTFIVTIAAGHGSWGGAMQVQTKSLVHVHLQRQNMVDDVGG
jgi:hypothetical protein